MVEHVSYWNQRIGFPAVHQDSKNSTADNHSGPHEFLIGNKLFNISQGSSHMTVVLFNVHFLTLDHCEKVSSMKFLEELVGKENGEVI